MTPRKVDPILLFNVFLITGSLLAGLGFITAYGPPTPPGPSVLPLEVIGPDGYTVAVTVDVGNASGVDRLWMQLHNLSSEEEGSVRVNGGPWVALDNRTVTCAYPESELECVGGAYKTIRGSVRVSGIVSGANTLEFRHHYTSGSRSSGFRVLRLDLLRGNGSGVLADDAFGYDDPAAWTPPRGDAGSIAAGRQLWERENVLVDGPGSNVVLRASCSDCHAKGGEDLKYFNYSNRSIIERSRFHGLSQADGEKIASFIRSLGTPSPGTPWDPPYQPGPGLDSRPAAEWAAGAGLDAVLDRDAEMLPYLFPDGISPNDVSTTATLNVREMPVAIQFPDWNEWLPRVHPKDAWGNVFLNHEVYDRYDRGFPAVLAQGVPQAVASGDIVDEIEGWANSFREFKKDTNKEFHFGGYDADGEVADYMLGLFQWQAVKTWEIMTTHPGLETAAPQIYPGTGEPRSWFGRARAVFDTAPHINGPDQAGVHPQGSELQNRYFSTAWYQVQMTLNAGNRRGLNIRPHDWKYHMEHIRGLGKSTGIREPMRFYQSYAKMMQQADNAEGVGTPSGWHMRHVTPAWLLADRPGTDKDVFQDLDPALRAEITGALLKAFMDKMDRHALSEWPREAGLEGIEPASYRPQEWPGSGLVFDQTTYADHFYRALPRLSEIGVDAHVLQRLAEWSEAAWPLGDWDSRYDPPTGPPPPGDDGEDDGGGTQTGLYLSAPVEGGVYPGVVPVTVAFGSGQISLQVVKLLIDGNRVARLQNVQTPVQLASPELAAGPHTIVVVAKDASGTRYETEPVQITVGAAEPIAESIPLTRGWNTVTLSVQPADARMDAVMASVSDVLKKVLDDQGREFNPSQNIREFTTWDASRTYEVKVGTAATLVVEGVPVARMAGATVKDTGAAGLRTGEELHVFELGAAAPNPSRGRTRIAYGLAEAGPVRLELFNVVGQLVRTVVDETRSAGPHTAEIDVSGLAAGVYVCRLVSGPEVATGRIVVVR